MHQNENLDQIKLMEKKLKDLWTAYIEHFSQYGSDENAKKLRDEYFDLYRTYKRQKIWHQFFETDNGGSA